ncbi:hypothetical protein ONZ43_g4295 [Nemania bipapillata]|uniref:Uncharacterized protein n=1 Tax=Nemania bipapillata TaxID=110536 RepID=A0ACC2IPK3_9PEZI|nr:hypothetical protein ONZ43_g4295 [Nemania bipapillata]
MADLEGLDQLAGSCPNDENLSLILSLLQEEAQYVGSKGKQKEGTVTDAGIALRLYTEELGRAATYASDRRMARSIQDAVQTDTAGLVGFGRAGDVARRGRGLAVASSQGRPHEKTQTSDNNDPSKIYWEMFDKLLGIFVTGIDEIEEGDELPEDDTETQPESSSWAASRRPKKSRPRPCIACGEMYHFIYLARAPCRHEYCRGCLKDLFQHAMLDESLFPPRCCREEIPVDANRLFLNSELVQEFKKKAVEFSTPNRTYCHRPTCSAFIPPAMVKDDVARCPQCNAQTCVICTGAMHGGDCPWDTELQRTLELAQEEEWQRCPKCRTMIELEIGCLHMT